MRINPVLQKELKTKLRGWRTPVLISCYILLLGLLLYAFFSTSGMLNPYKMYRLNPRVAVDAYNFLIVFQFALLFLVVPAITATSISSERERQTLDLMLVTKTHARKIIFGKIMVSMAYTMLLLISSMPVVGMVFFFGGIGFGDILKLLLFYILTSFFVASSGVFFSTLFRKNIVSIIMTYIFLGTMTFGPFILLLARAFKAEIMNYAFNPTYADFLATLFPSPVFGFTSFYFSAGSDYYRGRLYTGLWGNLATGINSYLADATGIIKFLKPWIANGLFSIVASVLLIFLSSAILNPIRRKK